jgi:hypothetical protein
MAITASAGRLQAPFGGPTVFPGLLAAVAAAICPILAAAAARIFPGNERRSSPTECGPPGFAIASGAPQRNASRAVRHDVCANELITIVGSG